MKTSELMKRFVPYYGKYWRVMVFDLFCASLTTICELVLPMILRFITNEGMRDLASITSGMIIRIALVYFGLRIIDGMAAFYMAYTGHVMGARIETDMRQDIGCLDLQVKSIIRLKILMKKGGKSCI